jgi:hypothetical protein
MDFRARLCDMASKLWTPENVALLGKLPDDALAGRVGCTVHEVREVRCRRGIHYCGQFWKQCPWTERELKLFHRYGDLDLAKATGRTVQEVAAKRLELGNKMSADRPTKS